MRDNLPRVPVLVVATQTDQRDSGPHSASCSSAAEGKRLAQDIRAKGYLECSSLSNRGVQQVFECAVRTAVNQARKRTRPRMFDINSCVVFWPLNLLGGARLGWCWVDTEASNYCSGIRSRGQWRLQTWTHHQGLETGGLMTRLHHCVWLELFEVLSDPMTCGFGGNWDPVWPQDLWFWGNSCLTVVVFFFVKTM